MHILRAVVSIIPVIDSGMENTKVFPERSSTLQKISDTTHKQDNAQCIKLLSCGVVVLAALCIGIMAMLSLHMTKSGSSLQEDFKTYSVEVEVLQEELKRHGEDMKELKTKYLNQNRTAEVKSRDCEELSSIDNSTKSGIFTIYPTSNISESSLPVYCDMTTQGGGWIVIQRRQDGSQDFFLGWQEYKTGFGKLNTEFWLGLDNIYALVSDGKWELLINMKDDSKEEKYAMYKAFSVGPESGGYELTVEDFSGDAGDSLTAHNGMKFSTKDRANDIANYNCAVTFTGAWWYKGCHYSNLNGFYGRGGYSGPSWKTLSGPEPVEFIEMKIKTSRYT